MAKKIPVVPAESEMKLSGRRRIVEAGAALGRPAKLELLSKADRQRFLQLLRVGTPASWACRSIRMSVTTLENYRIRAARGEQPYVEFVHDMDEASSIYVCSRLQMIDSAGIGASTAEKRSRGDYRATAWLLERLFPADFAATAKTEVAVKNRTDWGDDSPSPEQAAAIVRAKFGDHARRALVEDDPAESEGE